MVRIRAIRVKIQLAKNLPTTNCVLVTGKVINNSIVPDLLSSAHNLIPIAGINTRNSHGCHEKNAIKSAWSLSKNLPKKKVIPEDKAKKTSKKIDANGVLKYPFNSLSKMIYVLLN